MTKLQNLLKGLIKENPVFVLVLGTCPTLAISTSVPAALGMGLAATAVLVLSNMAISALRKVIPDRVRIPCYIVLIAGFVTVVELLMKAYAYGLYESLGVYLSLIVVNCIILGRAEMYANKHGVVDSAIDGLGMGLGFTLALCAMGTVREVLGAGTFCGLPVPWFRDNPIGILTMAPGGFRSYFGADRRSPCRYLYMSSAAEPCAFTPEHAIVKYGLNENGMPVHIVLPSFEELGLQYLSEASSYPLIVLDECGRLEQKLPRFRARVLELLDGDVPVLGAVRQDAMGWLEDIRNHPKVQLITVTEQNRNDLPLQLAEYYAPFIKPIKEE